MRFFWFVFCFLLVFGSPNQAFSAESKIFHTRQTSGSLLIKYAESVMEKTPEPEKKEAREKYILMYDIYIKASSYAILNKIFFWLSVLSGLIVLLWPSLSILFKEKLSKWEWLKSATVQTTVTAIAALMFTFYSQYKDKQTYAETLMRHVLYSTQSISQLSLTVSDELSKIDRGFSFNSILEKETTTLPAGK